LGVASGEGAVQLREEATMMRIIRGKGFY